jgi:hypothetical protein
LLPLRVLPLPDPLRDKPSLGLLLLRCLLPGLRCCD